MRKICYLCLVLSLFACGDKPEEKEKEQPTQAPSNTVSIEVEEEGEYDPIANPGAVKGGTYTTWGSSFPKSLNMFLSLYSNLNQYPQHKNP